MVRQGLRIEVCKCGEYLRVFDADNLLVFDTVFGAARNENTTLNVQFSVSYSIILTFSRVLQLLVLVGARLLVLSLHFTNAYILG
jgi:hypothetical protein